VTRLTEYVLIFLYRLGSRNLRRTWSFLSEI
jgi:hypothetical protein